MGSERDIFCCAFGEGERGLLLAILMLDVGSVRSGEVGGQGQGVG